jgi:hypothetical protein
MTCVVLGHGGRTAPLGVRERKFEAGLKAKAYCSRPERIGPEAPVVHGEELLCQYVSR